jgi:hypothetical protein
MFESCVSFPSALAGANSPNAAVFEHHKLTVRFVQAVAWIGLFCSLYSFQVCATELKPSTARAFQEYVNTAEAQMQTEADDPDHFLRLDALPEDQKRALISRLRDGEIVVQPMRTNGHETPTQVPGGLVHHWLAVAFVPGVTAGQVLQLSQDYPRYGELYRPDVQYAKILSHDGEYFDVDYRFYRHTIVSVTYNAEFEVNYFTPDSSMNYSQARSIRIAEVQNAGKPSERELPVGNDHGYMWRANFYSRCLERDGGVYIEIEFVALTRTVPMAFAWLVNPYMRSIPREYLTRYIGETRNVLSHP